MRIVIYSDISLSQVSGNLGELEFIIRRSWREEGYYFLLSQRVSITRKNTYLPWLPFQGGEELETDLRESLPKTREVLILVEEVVNAAKEEGYFEGTNYFKEPFCLSQEWLVHYFFLGLDCPLPVIEALLPEVYVPLIVKDKQMYWR